MLAVVVGEPITLSDVTAAIRLGLVPSPAGSEDRVQAVLTRSSSASSSSWKSIATCLPNRPRPRSRPRLAAGASPFRQPGRARDGDAGNRRVEAQLRARIRDDVRLETYLKQRFGGSYQPSEEEVARYYRSHESDFIRSGVLRPYEEVRDEARQRLVDERSATLIRDWIAGLRRRTDVTVLPK